MLRRGNVHVFDMLAYLKCFTSVVNFLDIYVIIYIQWIKEDNNDFISVVQILFTNKTLHTKEIVEQRINCSFHLISLAYIAKIQ